MTSIILQNKQMVKSFSTVKLGLFLALLSALAFTQTALPVSVPLTLGNNIAKVQNASTYIYFSCTLNTSQSLLAITVDPKHSSSLTEYVSLKDPGSNQAYIQFPNGSNHYHKCVHSDLNTCILDLSDSKGGLSLRQVTVYISVYAQKSASYSIVVDLINDTLLALKEKVSLDFSKKEAAVLRAKSSGIQTSSVLLTYSTVGGEFNAIAGFDAVPNSQLSQDIQVEASSFGPYSQKLVFPSFLSNQSDIFILISSQKGSIIEVEYSDIYHELLINSTIYQSTSSDLDYEVQTDSTDKNGSLYLRMTAFEGYGSFSVAYCQNITWQFDTNDQVSFQIVIPPPLRALSADENETLVVSIVNPFSLSYKIELFQSNNDRSLILNQQTSSIAFAKNAVKAFPLSLSSAGQYFVSYAQLIGGNETDFINNTENLSFAIEDCKVVMLKKTCSAITEEGGLQGQLIFTAIKGHNYQLAVDASLVDYGGIFYNIMLSKDESSMSIIFQDQIYFQEIALREYKFYYIDLKTLEKNNGMVVDYAVVSITVEAINGDTDILSSLTIPNPTIDQYITNSSQIQFESTETISYTIDSTTKYIYVSVYGEVASLFKLYFTYNINPDLYIRYNRLQDNVNNTFTLNHSNPYKLLSFSSHVKPYTITVAGNPQCIRFGYSLPLSQTCSKQLPSLLTEPQIYLNISNGNSFNSNFSFSVLASSGYHELTRQNAIMMSCSTPCFALINATLQTDSRVLVKGPGEIQSVADPSQTNVKDTLAVACPTYPCHSQINASLPFGGSMSVFLAETQVGYLDGSIVPFHLVQKSKKAILPIKSSSDINNLIARSDGITLNAIYQLYSIDTDSQNILNINFTVLQTKIDSMVKSNPLRNLFIFTVPQSDLIKLNCDSHSVQCVMALVFIPDYTVPFNLKYSKSGIASISSTTAAPIRMSINQPTRFNSSLQLTDFKFENIVSNTTYKVNVEPLSNCNPAIILNRFDVEHEYNYGDVSFANPQQPITFSILTQKPCVYQVSLTNSPYRTIFSEREQHLYVENGQLIVILMLQDSKYPGFKLYLYEEDQGCIQYIMANRINNSYDGVVVPTLTSNSFLSINSLTLNVSESTFFRAYVIKIVTNCSYIYFLAQNSDQPILPYYKASNYLLMPGSSRTFAFISKKYGQLQIFPWKSAITGTIRDASNTNYSIDFTVDENIIIQIDQNSTSDQCVPYELTVQNNQTDESQVKLKYKDDPRYNRELYENIALYSVFTSTFSFCNLGIILANCYNYKAPLQLGRQTVIFDIVFDGEKETALRWRLEIKGMSYWTTPQIKATKLNSSGQAYQLEMKYLAGQEYKVCFYDASENSIINRQFYVLVNSPFLRHIVRGQPIVKYQPQAIDSYQIVQQAQSNTIMVQLTICDPSFTNDKILVGSSNHQLFGSYANITNYHKNSDSIFAIMSIYQGYYFIGVKSTLNKTGGYSLKYSNIRDNDQLLPSVWGLTSKEIEKVTIHNEDITISLPQLTSLGSGGTQTNITITYNIYIINMAYQDKVNPSAYIQLRCPTTPSGGHYPSFNLITSERQQSASTTLYRSVNFTYATLEQFSKSKDTVVIKINRQQVPRRFNITGRADVIANGQEFSYFYNFNYYELQNLKRSNGDGAAIAAIVIIILILITAGGIYAYIRYRRDKNAEKIEFQLANFEQNSAVVEKKQGLMVTPKADDKGYYEMNEQVK